MLHVWNICQHLPSKSSFNVRKYVIHSALVLHLDAISWRQGSRWTAHFLLADGDNPPFPGETIVFHGLVHPRVSPGNDAWVYHRVAYCTSIIMNNTYYLLWFQNILTVPCPFFVNPISISISPCIIRQRFTNVFHVFVFPINQWTTYPLDILRISPNAPCTVRLPFLFQSHFRW